MLDGAGRRYLLLVSPGRLHVPADQMRRTFGLKRRGRIHGDAIRLARGALRVLADDRSRWVGIFKDGTIVIAAAVVRDVEMMFAPVEIDHERLKCSGELSRRLGLSR